MYRVFIDEVGMRLEYERNQFTAVMDTIKAIIFGTPNIVLHRREMLDATPPFQAQNPEVRGHLDTMLLKLLAEGTYRVFTVVIDKREHLKKYVVWRFHPYHYCLTVLLERYVQFLERIKQVGDILTESRGKKENMQLEPRIKSGCPSCPIEGGSKRRKRCSTMPYDIPFLVRNDEVVSSTPLPVSLMIARSRFPSCLKSAIANSALSRLRSRTGFVPRATVNWNGNSRSITFLNSSQPTASNPIFGHLITLSKP